MLWQEDDGQAPRALLTLGERSVREFLNEVVYDLIQLIRQRRLQDY